MLFKWRCYLPPYLLSINHLMIEIFYYSLKFGCKLLLYTFLAKIVLEPSYSSGLKQFDATTAFYLINPYRLKQFELSLNFSFNSESSSCSRAAFKYPSQFRRCVMWEWTNSCSASAFCIRSWMAEFIFPLKYGFTILSLNSVNKEAGTLWNVKSTRNLFSIIEFVILFFICNRLFLKQRDLK